MKHRGALQEAALATLFGIGVLHWLYVFGFLTPGFAGMSFTVADWPKEVRYYASGPHWGLNSGILLIVAGSAWNSFTMRNQASKRGRVLTDPE